MSAELQKGARRAVERMDSDPVETREWIESLGDVIRETGADRALFLLDELDEQMRRRGTRSSIQPYSAYRNTIPLDRQGVYPGDLAIEEKITSLVRWNALAMVVKANQESRLLFIYFADIRQGAAGRTDCCSRMAGLQGFLPLRETERWLVSFGKR